jgi:hypothetical protein
LRRDTDAQGIWNVIRGTIAGSFTVGGIVNQRTRPRTEAPEVKTLPAARTQLAAARREIEALTARLVEVEKARAAERKVARQRLTKARRQFEQRSTRMVQEIGELRHHEARCRVLEASLAARALEIRRLSARRKR